MLSRKDYLLKLINDLMVGSFNEVSIVKVSSGLLVFCFTTSEFQTKYSFIVSFFADIPKQILNILEKIIEKFSSNEKSRKK